MIVEVIVDVGGAGLVVIEPGLLLKFFHLLLFKSLLRLDIFELLLVEGDLAPVLCVCFLPFDERGIACFRKAKRGRSSAMGCSHRGGRGAGLGDVCDIVGKAAQDKEDEGDNKDHLDGATGKMSEKKRVSIK